MIVFRLKPLPVQSCLLGEQLPTGNGSWKITATFFDEKLQSQSLADSGLFNMRGIQELQLLLDCGADIPWEPLLGVVAIAIWLESFF